MMYLVTELSSRLRVFRTDRDTPREIHDFPLPDGNDRGVNYPAAIRLSPDGTVLAVSCRGADGVAFFRVAPNGMLQPDGWSAVPGCWPRDILMLDHETLLCACQKSGDMSLLRRTGSRFDAVSVMRAPGAVSILPLS